MKVKFKSFLCMILVLSMILSLFNIFASAESGNGDSSEHSKDVKATKIYFNRNFEEGWDYTNGLRLQCSGGDFRLEYEKNFDLTYNYFLCMESYGEKTNDIFYVNLPNTRKTSGKYILEFDLKSSENCDFGDVVLSVTPGSGNARAMKYFVSVNDGILYVLGKECCRIDGEDWVHLGIIFDFDYVDEAEEKNYSVTAVWDNGNGKEGVCTGVMTAGLGGKGFQQFRFGYSTSNSDESWLGMDNLKIYEAETFCELPKDEYGSCISESKARDFPIIKASGGELSFREKVNDSILMKKNVDYCLSKESRQPILQKNGKIYGAPVEIDGEIMISLETLIKYIDYPYFIHPDGQSFDVYTGTSATYLTVGRKTATVGGERVELKVAPGNVTENGEKYLTLALCDVEKLFPGIYVTQDNMGLIVISRHKGIEEGINTKTSMEYMKLFVFDTYTPDEIFEMTKKKTNNFTHPYLMATQDRFDELRTLYNMDMSDEKYDRQFVANVVTVLNYAKSLMNERADFDSDGKYIGIKPEMYPVNKNYEKYPDGYTAGGECYVPIKWLPNLAFAYQFTLDENYLYFIYDWILACGTWPHWGPAHFLNTADSTWPVALSLDWTYNAMIDLGLDIDKCIKVMFDKGVHPGYLGTTGKPNPFAMDRLFRDSSHYTNRTNNWNAVCSSGMVIGSLFIMGEEGNPNYRKEATLIISENTQTLPRYGMGQYAPDGSYVESAGYWCYGTNSFYRMIMAMDSAMGTDFGLMDCWGLDRTCYFACQVEDSNFRSFSYHDGSEAHMDTSFFPFVGLYMNDLAIVSIRKNQVKNGKAADIWDTIYYIPDSEVQDVELPLDYYMEGIDGYTMRNSWEKNSMFAGIMGGDNRASHGQIDCGSFVYHNRGSIWFKDLGGDNYYLNDYWGDYRYYKKSAEGNNTLCLTGTPSVELGQMKNADGKIIDYGTNDFGTYVVMDNTSAFGGLATYWRRGMMATNDRNTVVVQDEVSFKGIRSLCWFGHYSLGTVKYIEITADGRTAYMHGSDGTVLRVAIVSPSLDFKFDTMDCYTYVLEATHDENYSPSKNGQAEMDRSKFNKLVIKAENVLSFNLAVAIEIIDGPEPDVGYKFCEMSEWEPYKDTRSEVVEEVLKRTNAKMTDIPKKMKMLNKLLTDNTAYTTKLSSYYRTLCDLEYACLAFANEDLPPEIVDLYRQKNTLLKNYDALITEVNANISTQQNFINSILG